MRLVALFPIALLVACGGDDEDSASAGPTCDDIVTAPMKDLTPEEFPEGIDVAIEPLQRFSGVWEAESCGPIPERTYQLKVVSLPVAPDEVTAVLQNVGSPAVCGCGSDEKFAADNQLDLVGWLPTMEVFLEPLEEADIDPGVDNSTFLLEGALFAGTQGLMFRGCGSDNISPALGSEYDRASVQVRIETHADPGDPLAFLGQVTVGLHLESLEDTSLTPLDCEMGPFEQITTR